MTDQLESNLRDAFHAAPVDQDAIARLSAIDYKPRQRRSLKLPALGTASVAAAVAVVVSLTSGAATAFAGWSSTPTTPAAGQLAQAAQSCGQGLGSAVLSDARGPYTASIYADSNTYDICLAGDALSMSSSFSSSSGLTTPAAGEISFGGGVSRDGAGDQLTLADGRVGTGVTAVAFDLSDGTTVDATVQNGWYMAWWPGSGAATTAQVTTASGTTSVSTPTHPEPPQCPAGAHCSASFAGSSAAPGSSAGSSSTFQSSSSSSVQSGSVSGNS